MTKLFNFQTQHITFEVSGPAQMGDMRVEYISTDGGYILGAEITGLPNNMRAFSLARKSPTEFFALA
ncbi:hypothetical protein AN642_00010 [Epulopiscium sp. SCG-B10WGA-EpuloA2]|nr:hypothetical protein AN642_00010 [Epulopiscium sp. SCG-B10WGA-EpuloA2]